MKVLLFGKHGQVGWELNRSLLPLGDVIGLSRKEADFSAPETLRKIVRDIRPDIIVNAAAYTAVDKAEEEESVAMLVNGESPGVLAEEALNTSALLVHYSTDYVFDGEKDSPYVESDRLNPVNAYGRTKLAGENNIISSGCDYLIFRTSWVYASRGSNFLSVILRLANEKNELNIVCDQIGSPTSARLIADTTFHCIHQSISTRKAGDFCSDIYHLAASDYTSWYGFAREIIDTINQTTDMSLKVRSINAVPTVDYITTAKRPLNSRLSNKKLQEQFDVVMPKWISALKVCIEELD